MTIQDLINKYEKGIAGLEKRIQDGRDCIAALKGEMATENDRNLMMVYTNTIHTLKAKKDFLKDLIEDLNLIKNGEEVLPK